jgi:phosphate transport system ATP-binding protein
MSASLNHTPALEVQNLEVQYGRSRALSNIHCSIPSRQVTAVMGPSGCGKSTFIKTLNRTLELTPSAHVRGGSVMYRGRDIYASACDVDDIRKHIGIIHQRPVSFPMSVSENVLFGARFHKLVGRADEDDYVRHYLERVGLWSEVRDRLGAHAATLSGGQQQRLCLARTLANQPTVILMDEPCSALDPAATRRIEELIGELERDYTIVIVTHNMSQARRVSRHTLFFYEGRLMESGPTQQIFEDPSESLTREFVTGQIG